MKYGIIDILQSYRPQQLVTGVDPNTEFEFQSHVSC
jgi:hypothetical protein